MTTDVPQSPLLFKDICYSAQFKLPNTLSNYHVLIQKLENSSEKGNMQRWTFYNSEEWIEMIVITVATPDGENDFFIFD